MWIDDLMLERSQQDLCVSVWIPSRPLVVLGSGNDATRECHLEQCTADGVAVFKRYGGGGTVVLHPSCVVASIGAWVSHPYRNDFYFARLNEALIAALTRQWPAASKLQQRGISDLAWGERKVAGTSLFRSRNYLLYQASLLVEAQADLMERYLAHPSREPNYRQQKSHRQFVGGLADFLDGAPDTETVAGCLREHLTRCVSEALGDELQTALPSQLPHLYAKAAAQGTSQEVQAWAQHFVGSAFA